MKTPPAVLLALDSGFPDAGAALFVRGQLQRAAWIKVPPLDHRRCPACLAPCDHGTTPDLLVRLADQLEAELGLAALDPPHPGLPSITVAEWAGQIFELHKARARVRGLSLLTGFASIILDRAASWGSQLYQFTPSDWKGSTPKRGHQAQALCYLSPPERAVLPRYQGRTGSKQMIYRSDPLDAAALGVWWLARCGFRQLHCYGLPSTFLTQVEPHKSSSPPRLQGARAVRTRRAI